MSVSKPMSVIIDGDKDNFLSKNAINRFKTDIKKCDVKKISIEDGKYLKQGYVFNINFKDNTFYSNIISLEEHMKIERRKMLKNKLKKSSYQRSKNVKNDINSLKRTVPDKLFKSYMNLLKQYGSENIPSPDEVIQNPEKFKQQISLIMGKNGMVSNNTNVNNAIKKYFNDLGNYTGVEPAQFTENNNTQSEQQNLNVEVDTEDEDEAPDLINCN